MPALVAFDTLPELFLGLADHFRGSPRPALRYKDKRTKDWVGLTWDEVNAQIEAMMGYLYKQGVRPGDRVAILSENRPEWAVTDMATQRLGAVNVSLYTSIPASQVGYIVKDSESRLIVVSTGIQLRKAEEIFDECPALEEVITMSEMRKEHPAHVSGWDAAQEAGAAYWAEHRDEIAALAAKVKPDDLSALIYTSGTTGNPKGVMLTHENFCSNTKAALDRVPFGPDDHHLSFLPLCHSFERTAGYTAVLACGARISYAESIDAVSKNLPEVQPTVMISVPRLFERMYNVIAKSVAEGTSAKKKIFNWAIATGKKVADKQSQGKQAGPFLKAQQSLANKLVFAKLHEKLGGNLRFAVSGGAALPKAIGEFFVAAGVTIIEGYGLTETSPVLTINPINAPRYGTVGHVIDDVTVGIQHVTDGTLIAQLKGQDYPSTLTSEPGEIVCKGPNIMRGYWNNDDSTAEAIDADGWYHTGDVGRFVDGYLAITDRIKHMIVSKGGKNIYPGPIEEQFKTNALIDQIIVIGEGREFLSALVVPNFDALNTYAHENGIDARDEALVNEPAIQQLFKTDFRAHSKQAAAHEKIRDFRLVAEPFTVDNEMMTPTLKLKRRVIETRFADLIEEMYASVV